MLVYNVICVDASPPKITGLEQDPVLGYNLKKDPDRTFIKMAILTVVLNKVTNLKDGDTIGKTDPYIKFELEQDNIIFDKNYGDKKSSKKKDDVNPVYHETFTWEIPDTEGVNNLVLTCKIMDDDMLFDDKIGVCKIKLEDLALSAEPIGIDRVVDNNWFCKDARIYLTISYS